MNNLKFIATLACLLHASFASAALITFENDPAGEQPNGFVSADYAGVSFYDTSGANLQIGDFEHQSDGQGLAVLDDDTSMLQMNFTEFQSQISIAFGNDDPSVASEGDRAWLLLWDDHYGIEVARVSVALNLDDALNQTISSSGRFFDLAFFYFGDADGNPINLIESVDNIQIGAVPLPGAVWLFGSGLLGLLTVSRKRACN